MAQISRRPDYSDLDLDFIPHPTTKDVVRKIGADAVKRSVRNLILTNYYDKPFRPGIGSNVPKLLFENANPLIENFLRDAIANVLGNFEPRIRVVDIRINFDFDNNGYNVTLSYIILNREEPITTSIFLERIR
jgi:phage baseplate assembly protein W